MFIKTSLLSRNQKIKRIILSLLIVLTVGFIFFQSTLSPEVAGQESEAVSGIISDALPPDSPSAQYANENMDKIAHFTEFGLLGLFVSLYICGFAAAPMLLAPASVIFALSVAIIDETIQIFSGRTSDFADIGADVLGFFIISMIIYIAFFAIRCAKRKKENKW